MAERLTNNHYDKVWMLHEKGLSPLEIADTLGISKASVHRVIRAFAAAKAKDFDALYDENITDAIRTYAMERFGLAEVKERPEEKAPDQTATFCVAVLEELRRTNALLEKLCKAWGVE